MNNIELKKVPFINEVQKGIKSFSLRASALVKYQNKYVMALNEGQKLYKHPGGHVNIDESILDALKREIKEEIGLFISSISENQPFFDYVQIESNIMINAYFIIEVSELECKEILKNAPLPVKILSKEELNQTNTWESEIRAVKYFESKCS